MKKKSNFQLKGGVKKQMQIKGFTYTLKARREEAAALGRR